MQLSQKQKAFAEFFFAFLKPTLNFKHLPNKADVFPKIPAPKNMVR